MADFKQLRGNRLLLDLPEKEESKFILDKETEEAVDAEYLLKLNRLTVYSVGDLVTDINIGDEVLIDLSALRGKPVKFNIGGKERLLVSPFDVILIW
jgi:hypothetical protein